MFLIFGQQVSLAEVLGFITGILAVWLTIRQNLLCFPVGIINVSIYSYVFFDVKYFANSALQLVYIILLVYGWINWKVKSNKHELHVSVTNKRLGPILLIVGLITSAVAGYLLKKTTDAPLPYLDAVTTSMSLVAQWMVAQKKLENWLVWIAADIIYVGMYAYQSLYLTAILYFIFLILAVKGYYEWKKTPGQSKLGV